MDLKLHVHLKLPCPQGEKVTEQISLHNETVLWKKKKIRDLLAGSTEDNVTVLMLVIGYIIYVLSDFSHSQFIILSCCFVCILFLSMQNVG